MSDGEEDASKEESPPPAITPDDEEEPEVQAELSAVINGTSEEAEADATMQAESTAPETPEASDVKKEDVHEPHSESLNETADPAGTEQSRDWIKLSMLEKLDSLHLLTEWQFQNPYRLRQQMKSDDETASWVSIIEILVCVLFLKYFPMSQRVEPIGYDAKTNAYWLIGRKLTVTTTRIFS